MNTILMPSAGVLDPTRGGEHIDRLVRGRSITELPTHRAICERYYAEVAEIDGTLWNDQEKARRKAVAREAAYAGLAKDLEDAIKARSREFEQAEGMAVAAARRDEELSATDAQARRAQALTSEWTLLLSAVPNETDINQLALLAENAALTEHAGVYRAALSAITQQTGRLAAVERRRSPVGSMGLAQIAHAKLEGEFSAWRKQHPTPAERKRDAANGRERMRMEIQSSAALYRKFYGLE